MKILFAGDSITKGTTGASFIDMIREEYPDWIIENLGVNGNTIKGISERLISELQSESVYDWIVIQGGYNDIMLPYFKQMDVAFKMAAAHQEKKGVSPVSGVAELIQVYVNTIDTIRELSQGNILLLTLGCINEHSVFLLNDHKRIFNQAIRSVADRNDCFLADTGAHIDMELINRNPRDYFLGNFLQVMLESPLLSVSASAIDYISRRRNLSVTIDGVHLNLNGARIFKEAILESIVNSKTNSSEAGMCLEKYY